MLNKNNERELAYVVRIDDIKPIEGRDRVECAKDGGQSFKAVSNEFLMKYHQ